MKKIFFIGILIMSILSCQKSLDLSNENVAEGKKSQDMNFLQSQSNKNGVCLVHVRFGRPKHSCDKFGACSVGIGCGPASFHNGGEPTDQIELFFQNSELAIEHDLTIDDDLMIENGDDTEEHYFIKRGIYSYNEENNSFIFDVYFE